MNSNQSTINPDGTLEQSRSLLRDGYLVLKGLHNASAIQEMRARVLENIDLLKNTRPNPSAGHLAGFHRYPALEPLHTLLSSSEKILSVLRQSTNCNSIRSIGLSDITINRSQEWHVDLLRGKYRHHLNPEICWGVEGGGVYKVLLYLQPGNSLKIIPGAHGTPIPLDNDHASQPKNSHEVRSVFVDSGDTILMDIRLPHRGSSEAELENKNYLAAPKILISTVLGGDGKPLTKAMEIGNFERLSEWDASHHKKVMTSPRQNPADI